MCPRLREIPRAPYARLLEYITTARLSATSFLADALDLQDVVFSGGNGPNHAADPIVTRYKKGKLQMVLVRRTDGSNKLAFPGGMVDPGDTHSQTLRKEFSEEAARPGGAVDRLFSFCSRGKIYRGPVDDWRNTDYAWIETHAEHFHASDEVANELVLETSDPAEVSSVDWWDVEEVTDLYASHKEWLDDVYLNMLPER